MWNVRIKALGIQRLLISNLYLIGQKVQFYKKDIKIKYDMGCKLIYSICNIVHCTGKWGIEKDIISLLKYMKGKCKEEKM